MRKVPVLEIFGPTIQGEGMTIGRKTLFVRTAGCDYSCSWCDSAFTWDGSQRPTMMTAPEIMERLMALGLARTMHVTLSGGNPLLHASLGELVEALKAMGVTLTVETQASIWQDWLLRIDDVTLSPKPPSSGMTTDLAVLDCWVERLQNHSFSMKIVVFDDADYAFVKLLYVRYPNVTFYVQPGNADTTAQDEQATAMALLKRYEWLIDKVNTCDVLKKIYVLPQLHALVWGNRQGV